MAQPVLIDTLLSQMKDLERRLVALERSPQLTKSSIKEGALEVVDAAGVVRVRIGKDGADYGVKVYDAAGLNAVSLATLAFGQGYAEVLPEESTTSTSFTDLATPGPSKTVTVGPSGRAIVMGGAYMTSTVTNQTVVAGLKVDADPTFDLADLGNNTSGSIAGDHSAAKLIEGLSAGAHTFKLQYLQSLGGATGRFAARWLLVLPL
jgi:hypothetical protein